MQQLSSKRLRERARTAGADRVYARYDWLDESIVDPLSRSWRGGGTAPTSLTYTTSVVQRRKAPLETTHRQPMSLVCRPHRVVPSQKSRIGSLGSIRKCEWYKFDGLKIDFQVSFFQIKFKLERKKSRILNLPSKNAPRNSLEFKRL